MQDSGSFTLHEVENVERFQSSTRKEAVHRILFIVEELESDDEPNAYERPSGWKKNKGKRKANGELKDFRPVDSFLTQRSLIMFLVYLTMYTVSRVFEDDASTIFH